MPDEKDKPRLDQPTFGRLLEAAYVLQEHSRELRKLEGHLELRRGQSDSLEPDSQETGEPKTGSPEIKTRQLLSDPIDSEEFVPAQGRFSLDSLPSQPFSFEPAEKVSTAALPAAREPANPAPPANYTATLAQIVQTQHQIRARKLELENSMSLVAQRVTEIAKAGGAAIGFFDAKKNMVRYRGVAGRMTLPAGTEVGSDKALCAACLRTGQVIRCADVNPEFLFDPEECRRRGIQALIVVPIFHEGGIAGALELYYPSTQAFTEQDVHTCQLMAGLITEALAREQEEDLGWKKSLANERAVMLEALERLKPNLATLTEPPPAKATAARSAALRTPGAPAAPSAATFVCRNCGHLLVGQEQFCGKCGLRRGDAPGTDRTPARNPDYAPPSMQSKLASLREVQEAINNSAVAPFANGGPSRFSPDGLQPDHSSPNHAPPLLSDPTLPEKPLADSIEEEMPELFAAPELRSRNMPVPEEFHQPELPSTALPGASFPSKSLPGTSLSGASVPGSSIVRDAHELVVLPELAPLEESPQAKENEAQGVTALVKPAPQANWSSALSAREFLEQLAIVNHPGTLARFWRARRGDIYLAIAVLLVAAVIRWGIWSSHSVSATGKPTPVAAGHRNPAPDADLSAFDRMLISLGLADPPAVPEYKGNPETQVWVDLHTALYYCPGTDLYGKTPKGKFSSQRDAQLDQFEPAYRKACD